MGLQIKVMSYNKYYNACHHMVVVIASDISNGMNVNEIITNSVWHHTVVVGALHYF